MTTTTDWRGRLDEKSDDDTPFDENLSRRSLWRGHVADGQNLGSAVLGNDNGLHPPSLASFRPPPMVAV